MVISENLARSSDLNDPLTWPKWRKCLNFGLLSAMTATIFTGIAIQPLFWARMRVDIGLTTTQLVQSQAILLGTEAVSCVVSVPFARKYGRRLVCAISTAVFAAAVWWAARMKSAPELFITSVMKGIAGAVNGAVVQMSIRDLFPIHQRATFNGVYFVSMKFGLFLSPMAAGAQAATYGWRSSYMTLAAVMTVLSVAFVFCFEETKFVHSSNCFDEGNMKSAENNVKHRTVILEQSLQDSMPRPETPFRDFPNLRLLTSTNESLWKLLYQPIFSTMIPHVLITGIIFGAGLCFITIMASMQSIIFSEPPYRFTARELGLMHLGPFVGALLGSVYGGYLNDKFIKWASRRNSGVYEPEMRLYLIPVPVIAMAAGITIFGVTSDRGMHWIYPSIGNGASSFGFGAIADIMFTVVIDSYPNIVPQAFVVINFFRNTVSLIGLFALNPWREKMSVSSMFILAAALSLAVNCLIIPMAVFGWRFRASTALRYSRLSKGAY